MLAVDIVVLGSGGVVPTSERLTPSFLVYDWRGYTLLLDAGEGAQMRLHGTPKSPHDVNIILLTHEHGDHVNGLAGLLQSMSVTGREKPLRIGGPPRAVEFARDTLEATTRRLGFQVEYLELMGEGSITLYEAGGDRLQLSWGPSCHTPGSLAYRLEWIPRPRILVERLAELGLEPGPWIGDLYSRGEALVEGRRVRVGDIAVGRRSVSITYTGDTAPCSPVIELARGATLLIHDSTYASDLEGEALTRGHSTAEHAALAAGEAGAEHLLLFHVSPRYRGMEAWSLYREAYALFPKTMLAWDLQRLRLRV